MNWHDKLNAKIIRCRLCPRLVKWREAVGREKKREFRDCEYWAKPVPSFGDPDARLLVIGLAPAAHGGNRTGGFLQAIPQAGGFFERYNKAGFANQPTWQQRNDGMKLLDCYITAAIHCAPPGNKPLLGEIKNCSRYLSEELRRLKNLRVVIALGQIAFANYLKTANPPKPWPKFAHNTAHNLGEAFPTLIASYHPSRQNTNTRKLTEPMFDAVFAKAKKILTD